MVCYRLLTLDGKGRLIVIRYGCLWQNYPAQVLVNLFVPTYITAPLRTNQKYVYKKRQLQVHKIRKYAKHSDLYAILYQRLTKALLKGALLRCKRASFTPQKSIFYLVKGHLLLGKRADIKLRLRIIFTTGKLQTQLGRY